VEGDFHQEVAPFAVLEVREALPSRDFSTSLF